MNLEQFLVATQEAKERKAKRLEKRKQLGIGIKSKKKTRIKSRKTLIRLLDKTCAMEARETHIKRFGSDMCKFCYLRGKHPSHATQCFHYLSRQHFSTRWLPENLGFSCAGCNILYELDADFVSRVIEWYKENFGVAQWELLTLRYHKAIPVSTNYLRDMLG